MPNWNSLKQLLHDYQVTIQIVHVVFGLYVWEWLISLKFEWDFMTGKKKFRWPLIFYLLNRYCLMVLLITLLIMFDAPNDWQYDCPTVYTLSHFFGLMALVTATINLTIRTIALWSNTYVTAALFIATVGHIVLMILDVTFSKGIFLPGFGCGPANPETTDFWLKVTFLYALCLDFVVLVLNIYKLTSGMGPLGSLKGPTGNNLLTGGSKLAQMIFQQGLVYFLVALLTDVISCVFLTVQLNLAMSTITIAPSQVLSTVVACRAVRALTNFRYDTGSEAMQTIKFSHSSNTTRNGASSALRQMTTSSKSIQLGVLVEMETITMMDDSEKV